MVRANGFGLIFKGKSSQTQPGAVQEKEGRELEKGTWEHEVHDVL